MKKNIIYIFLIIFSVFAFSDVSYRTYTLGPKGYITETRTAFVPEKVLKPSVLNAEDLFIDNQNNLYIADTGNMRLLKIYQDGSEESFGDFEVFMPTGIYVKNNKIYVADSGNFSVAVYDENGFLIKTIEKPSEPLFGIKNLFIPLKIAVDNRENIYIVNEGSTNGLVNLNSEGNFMNYFAANQPDVSLKMILQRIIYSGNNNFLKIKPPSPTNLTIDKDGLIYTTTYGQENDGIKKFDIAGNNILSGKIFSSSDIVDVATDRDNNIYALTSEGYIFIS
ncbi:MAG TPA: hypothetical protein PLS66_10705, partial [Tepiditoga sp.]|nr:hypothetical protein [Tepiditoga sp.]